MKTKVSDELTIRCCQAMAERNANGGDWPAGLPNCIREVCVNMEWMCEVTAVTTALHSVSMRAVEIVAATAKGKR